MEKLSLNSCVRGSQSAISKAPLRIVHPQLEVSKRTSQRFLNFLTYVYRQKNGRPLKCPKSYFANWKMAIKELGYEEDEFHLLAYEEVQQERAYFADLKYSTLEPSTADNLTTALRKYKLYVDYTRGNYNPVSLAA